MKQIWILVIVTFAMNLLWRWEAAVLTFNLALQILAVTGVVRDLLLLRKQKRGDTVRGSVKSCRKIPYKGSLEVGYEAEIEFYLTPDDKPVVIIQKVAIPIKEFYDISVNAKRPEKSIAIEDISIISTIGILVFVAVLAVVNFSLFMKLLS